MPRLLFNALRSPAAIASFLLTALAGLALDQWTKVYAVRHLVRMVWTDSDGSVHVRDSEVYRFIPGWVHFTVTYNPGAVFGLGPGRRALFIAVSVAAIFFILYLFSVSGRQRFYQIILGMLLAGVLGNLYDRITFGYVRDMIHALPDKYIFGRPAFPWIFNVADSLLCVGVALMVLHSFLHPVTRAEGPGAENAGATAKS
jgi:signal peptidase II